MISKYGKDFLKQSEESPKNMSLMFKDIWSCRKHPQVQYWLSDNKFKWTIGEGKGVSFWCDWWWGRDTLRKLFPRLYSLALEKEISVADFIVLWQDKERLIWSRQLRGWEIDSEKELEVIVLNTKLSRSKDKLCWLVNNGKLNSKDLYDRMDTTISRAGDWNILWKLKIPN